MYGPLPKDDAVSFVYELRDDGVVTGGPDLSVKEWLN
jgi:hypothetical protein